MHTFDLQDIAKLSSSSKKEPSSSKFVSSSPSTTKVLSTIVYEWKGGELEFTLQRSKSKKKQENTKIIWKPGKSLDITFIEDVRTQQAVVKKCSKKHGQKIEEGQILLYINDQSVANLDFTTLMTTLQEIPRPCSLEFSSPLPSIVVRDSWGKAKLAGVKRGCILYAINHQLATPMTLEDIKSIITSSKERCRFHFFEKFASKQVDSHVNPSLLLGLGCASLFAALSI